MVSDNNLVISIIDKDENIVESITTVEDAKNMPTSPENIEKSLTKLGDTVYKVNTFNINYNQDIFIPISKLNEIRRNMLLELDEKRINKNNRKIIINPVRDIVKIKEIDKKYRISVFVRNEEQLITCIENNIDTIYTTDKELYNKYKELTNVFYKIPRVINKFIDIKNANILASELGSVNKYSKNNIVHTDYTLNVVNSKSIELLNKLNVKNICLSVELDYDKIKDIMKKDYNVELLIYGKVELMIMKYCPLKLNLNHCTLCKDNTNKYYLQDKTNNKYRILHNNCITSIMHYKNTDLINDINKYKELNIYNYRIDLLDEEESEIIDLINKVRNNF